MTKRKTHRPNLGYSPSLNGPCLCGSGKKFKRCCEPHYKGRTPGRSPISAFKTGDFKLALRECRADVTRYTIWHKQHTEPAYRAGYAAEFPLMDIDIRAMGELVDHLFYCYQQLNRVTEFPEVLERLRTNINEERWHRKVTYFHALCALWPNWNREAGRREFGRLGGVEHETDPEILQLYIDLFGANLTFSRKIALTNRAVEISEKRVDKLHYRGLLATQYLFVGDEARATQELEEAIAEFRLSSSEDLTEYESLRYAMALQVLGEITNNATMLDEAITVLINTLDSENWKPSGRAEILRSIGDIRRHQKKWQEALGTYESALKLDAASISTVFAADCLLRLDRAEEAAQELLNIDLDRLSAAERADYVFTFSVMAIETGEKAYREQAEQQLSELEFDEPYFREHRDRLLLELVKFNRSQSNAGLSARAKTILNELLSRARRYVILQPNIMGVGIDLGKIAEDVSSGSNKHQEKVSNEQDEQKK